MDNFDNLVNIHIRRNILLRNNISRNVKWNPFVFICITIEFIFINVILIYMLIVDILNIPIYFILILVYVLYFGYISMFEGPYYRNPENGYPDVKIRCF